MMNLPTKANDSVTIKVPVSFIPSVFSGFVFIICNVEVKPIECEEQDALHLRLHPSGEGSASELVTLACHYSLW